MSTDEPIRAGNTRARSATLVLAIGIALVLGSLAVPVYSDGSEVWSTEQALELQRASANLHRLSVGHDDSRADVGDEASLGQLRQAQAKFDALSEDLEAAKRRPVRIATLLRVLGLTLVVGGGVLYFSATRG